MCVGEKSFTVNFLRGSANMKTNQAGFYELSHRVLKVKDFPNPFRCLVCVYVCVYENHEMKVATHLFCICSCVGFEKLIRCLGFAWS